MENEKMTRKKFNRLLKRIRTKLNKLIITHILEINISNYVNRTYTLKCVYYHSGGEVMEQKYLRAGIKELVNECSDIELLYLIRSLLTV